MESLADALRMELRPWHLPVSLIEPGPTRTDMWGDALTEHERMTANLSEEHRRLYASHLAGTLKLSARGQKLAGDPMKVVKAVDHALTSQRPRRRYLIGNISRVQKLVLAFSPIAINDAMFSAATTTKVTR